MIGHAFGVWTLDIDAADDRIRSGSAASPPLGRTLLVARGVAPIALPAPAREQSAAQHSLAQRFPTLGEALERGGAQVVHATSDVTEALRLAIGRGSEFDAVVIALCGVDRFIDDWAGPRLAQRLRDRTDATVVVAVARGDYDGAAFAQRSGAAHLLWHGPPAHVEPSAATLPLTPGPELSPELRQLAAWFAHRFGGDWQPWMPQAAAAIAMGTDGSEQAAWCGERWGFDRPEAARRRLREFRALLSGEIRDDAALERRTALEVLAHCGRVGPIDGDLEPVRSLQLGAAAVRRAPELVRDLAVVQELIDLLEVADAYETLSDRDASGPGRPPAGAWRWRRDQALGRVAAARAPTAPSKQLLHESLRAGVQATLMLVHDALADAAAAHTARWAPEAAEAGRPNDSEAQNRAPVDPHDRHEPGLVLSTPIDQSALREALPTRRTRPTHHRRQRAEG